ncbi:MAG: hypothetical protein JXR91_00280 [Deltaproteobacteria bacterium]|nr:hypothetical protein [Deltaproteobacteria bacterium]
MKDLQSDKNETIDQLAERCIVHVQKRFNLTLDYTAETLSLLDYYVKELVTEENRGTVPIPGDIVRLNLLPLFAPTLGAYFGETLKRIFGGRWRYTNREPQYWRFEFDTFFVRLNPAGIAANAIAEAPFEEWAGQIMSAPILMPKLEERLNHAPQVAEDELFSFSTAFELIQITGEYLKALSEKTEPLDCSEKTYDSILQDR